MVAATRNIRQQQIEGTGHVVDADTKAMHDEFAENKYEIKRLQGRNKELKPELIERMQREGVDALSSEIEVDDEVRICKTTLEQNWKLKSKLDPIEEEE